MFASLAMAPTIAGERRASQSRGRPKVAAARCEYRTPTRLAYARDRADQQVTPVTFGRHSPGSFAATAGIVGTAVAGAVIAALAVLVAVAVVAAVTIAVALARIAAVAEA